MTSPIFSIADKLQNVRQRIQKATNQSTFNELPVTLLAVSKTRTAEEIKTLIGQGQTCFGESYLQEAIGKINALADQPVEWHFIGPIQSNKTRSIAGHFHWVQSVDRLKIAQRLDEQRPADLPPLNVCIQINISQEASKSGISLDQLDELARFIVSRPNLKLRGLMGVPQGNLEENLTRKQFQALRQAFDKLRQRYPDVDTLSMGMSADLEWAIQEGATMVRIGTDLFGPRHYPGSKGP